LLQELTRYWALVLLILYEQRRDREYCARIAEKQRSPSPAATTRNAPAVCSKPLGLPANSSDAFTNWPELVALNLNNYAAAWN
jgi:hypothetical protein